MRAHEFITETASAGATSAGNVATAVTGLWNGPTKGTYPYITPDYEALGVRGPMVTRAEPGGPEPFKDTFWKAGSKNEVVKRTSNKPIIKKR